MTADHSQPLRQPERGLPPVVGLLAAILVAAHALRVIQSEEAQAWLIYTFAIIPLRFAPGSEFGFSGVLEPLWPFIGHAFLHAGWLHLALNALFLLQGGVPVARGLGEGRAGGGRFALLCAGSAAAGGLAFLLANAGTGNEAVGASGAVCGVFGAYFIGARGDWRASLADPQVRAGIAVFLGINVGIAALARGTGVLPIAWEAHLGGFLAGLLLYPLLRPRT